MLTDRHIAVIGGDARQIEVIHQLTALHAQVSLIGFEQLERCFTGAMKKKMHELDPGTIDSIILPVHGADQTGHVAALFSKETITLTGEWLARTPEHCAIYTGVSTAYLDTVAHDAHRELIRLFDRDDMAIYNSIPTAEGVLMLAIRDTDVTIHQAKTMILGFGRTGKTIAAVFQALGAHVKIGSRNPAQIARAMQMGVHAFHLNNVDQEAADCDLCINTIPAPVLTEKVLAKMPTGCVIIDIASSPGGTDFAYAEKRGLKAMLAPGLPGKVAPKTAGRIIAGVLAELLQQHLSREEK